MEFFIDDIDCYYLTYVSSSLSKEGRIYSRAFGKLIIVVQIVVGEVILKLHVCR